MPKIKQISLVLCCIFSLFVSSVLACYCAHSEFAQQKEQDCAQQPTANEEKAENHSADHHSHSASRESRHETSSETGINHVDHQDACCIQYAPKIYAKSKGIAIQKQSALLLTLALVELKLVSQVASVETIQFAAPFYLSNSFYNLTPGRAPPRL
ncbi:MAG: hypothetical protein M3209_04330 [Acidobacteriota bacterium]|nr:hypothetical protein [Acidobacteriota bacterium]